MKIAVEAQPLLEQGKTGVGYYGYSLVKELSKLADTELVLEFFTDLRTDAKIAVAKKHVSENIALDPCRWFKDRPYRLLTSFIPIPRSLFFKNDADMNFYFNYLVPPCVHGKKVVVVHDMAFLDCPETVRARTKQALKQFLPRSLKRADRIITLSTFSKQRIMHYYDVAPEKISIIQCGVDTEIYYQHTDKTELAKTKAKYGIGDRYLLYLGTVEPRKNILRLLQAYLLFKNNLQAPPKMVIAGGKGWLYDEIFAFISKNAMEQDVIFTGYISDEEKVVLLSGAEIFCFPSLYEGFGMPVLEAMACGTPVLTSNAASMPEVGGAACEYCDPLSVENICKELELLWQNEARRRELSTLGVERAKLFNWRSSAEGLRLIFEELLP